jgi:hypothetical protein
MISSRFESPRLTAFQAKKSRTLANSAQKEISDNCTEVGFSSSASIQSEALSPPNTLPQGVLPLDVSSTQGSETNTDRNEWLCCGCIPISLPLIALISAPQASFDKRLLAALVDWAYTMSWGSFCSDHLMRLARFIPGEDPRDQTRADVIQNLEMFCSRECYSSMSTTIPTLWLIHEIFVEYLLTYRHY